MKIRVISMRESTRRRASIAQQFAKQGIAYEFFDALTPSLAPGHVDGYDESEFVLNCGRGARIEEPVDKFLQRFWRHGQRVYSILPAIVEHSMLAEESDIGHPSRDKYDITTRARRLVRKSANSLARTYSNVMFPPGDTAQDSSRDRAAESRHGQWPIGHG